MKTLASLLLFACMLTSIGCSSRGGNKELFGGRELPPPKEPPPVPARKDEPLDPALVEAARRQLVTAASAEDPVLRENAMEAVRRLKDPAARDIILKGLEDPMRVVRYRAALAAGEQRLADAKPLLEAMVDVNDPHLRIAVIFALHRLGITDHTHDLEQTAVNPEPGVRADTALVLGLLGEPSALKILKVLARDANPVVRQVAWESMWRLGDQSRVDELVGLTISKYADDQMLGLLALSAPRNETVRQHVRTGLTSDHTETSLVAARAMGQLNSDEGYGVALKGAQSNEGRHRFLAALAFGAIGRNDAQGVLGKLLKDRDQRVRVAAAAGLLEIASGTEAGLAGGS